MDRRNVSSLIASLVLSLPATGEEARQLRDISVTLKSDGKHCIVRDVTIPCTQLVAHLRDTLKLPYETTVQLRAGKAAPHEAVRSVLNIIDKSGFRRPVAYMVEPKSR